MDKEALKEAQEGRSDRLNAFRVLDLARDGAPDLGQLPQGGGFCVADLSPGLDLSQLVLQQLGLQGPVASLGEFGAQLVPVFDAEQTAGVVALHSGQGFGGLALGACGVLNQRTDLSHPAVASSCDLGAGGLHVQADPLEVGEHR